MNRSVYAAAVALSCVSATAPGQVTPARPPAPPIPTGPIEPPLPAGLDARDEVFYQIMPIAWRDSDHDEWRYGDFNGLTESLDYLSYLGVTAVWLNPIFPSRAYHGYQHGRADQVNPWFGTEPEFWNFVAKAKERGIKVFLDVVCYGISQDSDYFKSAFKNPASEYDSWLAFTDKENTLYTGYKYKTWTGDEIGFINWDLRTPPTGSGKAQEQVIAWCKHWLDPNGDGDPSDGVAGFRLDHVWRIYNQGPDGWGYNTNSFWMPWKKALQSVNPQVFTFAEQADWTSMGQDLLQAHDAAFTKPMEIRARTALRAESGSDLYEPIGMTTAARVTNRSYLAVLGDHDVDRLASAIGADTPETLGRAKAAAAVLMLQHYPPSLYYGDEIGMLGKKANTQSDADDIPMREPMKWNKTDGAPMSNYFARNKDIYEKRYSKDNDGRSVEEQKGVPGSLLETYRELIALRKKMVAIRRGGYIEFKLPKTTTLWAHARTLRATPEDGVVVVVNVGREAVTAQIDLSRFSVPEEGLDVKDAATGAAETKITRENVKAYSFTVPAYGYRVLQSTLTPRGRKQNVPGGQ